MMSEAGREGAMDDVAESNRVAPKRVIVDTSTQDFSRIKDFLGFVDHTPFIHEYLRGFRFIFAPRRFGKSSHLDMMKKFLEIHCDENGEPRTSLDGPAKERKNYEIFKDTEIVKKSKYKATVNDRMGKCPVIWLDFKSDDVSIESHIDAINHFRKVVDEAFKQHEYLRKSGKLEAELKESQRFAQQFEGKRCFDKIYERENAVTVDLNDLAKYLHKHFEKEVYLLVDNFDSVFVSALYGSKTENRREKADQLERISYFLACLLKRFVNLKKKHVVGALVTGVSNIHCDTYKKILKYNMSEIDFLGCTGFFRNKGVAFYGASEAEIKEVVHKLAEGGHLNENFKNKPECTNENGELDEKKIIGVINFHYYRYFDSNGSSVHSLWSVLQFLASGKAEYYWNQTDAFETYYNMLRSKSVADNILSLMRRGSFWVDYKQEISLEDLLNVYDLILNGKLYHGLSSLKDSYYLYVFLMEQGFLSNTDYAITDYDFARHFSNSAMACPNLEIKRAFSEMMPKFVNRVLAFNETHITQCAKTIDEISLSNEADLGTKMLNVYEHLTMLLKGFESPRENFEMSEFAVLCVVYTVLLNSERFKCADPFSQIRTEDHRFASSAKADFLTVHKTENFAVLWQFKCNKEEASEVAKTSVFAVREAKGEESNDNTRNDCLQGLEQVGLNKVVVVGLSVNGKCELSLAYALKDDSRIFFVSNYECESHKDYYDNVSACQVTK